jgi:Diacylglycerol kinase accessory domain
VQVRETNGSWRDVLVPSSVKAIVLLNLQSYGGGRDLWGLKDHADEQKQGWKTPIFNDGVFEVTIFTFLCNLQRLLFICGASKIILMSRNRGGKHRSSMMGCLRYGLSPQQGGVFSPSQLCFSSELYNLHCCGGGCDLWGLKDHPDEQKQGWKHLSSTTACLRYVSQLPLELH